MNEAELASVIEVIERHWHAGEPIPREAYGGYFHELECFGLQDAIDAVMSIARQGTPFIPLAGQIRRRVIERQLAAPTWTDARVAIGDYRKWLADNPLPTECPLDREGCADGWIYSEDENGYGTARACECRDLRTRYLRGDLHPLVRSFLDKLPYDEIREALGGNWGAEGTVRKKWDQHVERTLASAVMSGSVQAALEETARPKALQSKPLSEMATLKGAVEAQRKALPQAQ